MSYDRCRSVKTLLSQDRPLALLDIYVHLEVKCNDTTLTDDELIDNITDYRNIVLTGLAGSGKSMLMKYLTIRFFENPHGMIPLFVELRQLNFGTSRNLLAHIHQSCASAENKVTYNQFELALRAGGLLLILDGFDEVDFTHRDEISRQILEIAEKYPNSQIILSSRPDEKFAAWQLFYTFRVNALTKKQVLELIDNIDYDSGLKERFRGEVDGNLYESHKSFLSSPLLSSIMLLTYEQFAEIPYKMHIFYEQAFSALYRRHDAQKSQFIRKTYANLAIDDFRNFFSAFCMFSYAEENFAFMDIDLQKLVTQALQYAGVKAKSEEVLKDLKECLCILQRDGIYTIFVHRSFQEYFCAFFIANYHGPAVRQMLDKFAPRSNDDVIPMLFEMARDKIDREWTVPHIGELTNEITPISDARNYATFCSEIFPAVSVDIRWVKPGSIEVASRLGEIGDNFLLLTWIFKLYNPTGRTESVASAVFNAVERAVHRFLVRGKRAEFSAKDIESALLVLDGLPKVGARKSWEIRVEMLPETVSQLELTEAIRELVESLRALKNGIEKRIGGQDSLVEVLLVDRASIATRGRGKSARKRETN